MWSDVAGGAQSLIEDLKKYYFLFKNNMLNDFQNKKRACSDILPQPARFSFFQ